MIGSDREFGFGGGDVLVFGICEWLVMVSWNEESERSMEEEEAM